MKTTERILLILAVIGTAMKLCSIEGGVFLTFVSFTLLSLFYFFFNIFLLNGTGIKGFFRKVKEREITWQRICWSALTGIIWFIAVIGLLFYLNHWEGSMLLLTMGMALLPLILGVSLFKYVSRPTGFQAGILVRTAVLLILGVACLVIRWLPA